jgi:hypothetical protein
MAIFTGSPIPTETTTLGPSPGVRREERRRPRVTCVSTAEESRATVTTPTSPAGPGGPET